MYLTTQDVAMTRTLSMIPRLLALAAILTAAPAMADEFPTSNFDIKGAKLGDSIDLKGAQYPNATCETVARGVIHCKNPDDTIGGSPAVSTVTYLDGRIVRIAYMNIDIKTKEVVDGALAMKYGAPKVSGTAFFSTTYYDHFWMADNKVEINSQVNRKTQKHYNITLYNAEYYNSAVIDDRINAKEYSNVDI